MNTATNIRGAMKTARYNRRSWKGPMTSKGRGKKLAHRADRRLSKALARGED